MIDISVVIPLYNEAESLPELYAWIERVMQEHHFSFEVIFVNDGSTDDSWKIISSLSEKNSHVKGIKFRRNYGKSPALYCGFKVAEGNVVITMDADLQDSPDEIPELYRMIMEDGYDLVSGYKQKRYDPLSKTLPTKLFNATARKISGIKNLHDFNCGLKAYRRVVVKNIEVYGEMHRYMPYLAKNAGFDKIGEKVVHHQARKYGASKFMGWNRFINGYLLHCRLPDWCRQAVVPGSWHSPASGDRFPLFLHLPDDDDDRYATVLGWFLGRSDQSLIVQP